MIKSLITAAFLLTVTPTLVSAQDCDWKEHKKDPISEQTFIRSKKVTIVGDQKFGQADKKFLDLHIELTDGKVMLYGYFHRMNYMSDERISQPKLLIKLEDKTLVELNTEEAFSTKLIPPGITEINFRFQVSTNDLKALAKSPSTALRMSFSGQDFLFEMKDKKAITIQEQFKCMTQEI